ncbi:unnamed protein product, partial [Ectocarpus sp. 8 AP-2014]
MSAAGMVTRPRGDVRRGKIMRPHACLAIVMMLLLSLHGRAARIAPPFSAQYAKQVLASASARLHMPHVPRLQGPGATRTVVAVAAAATGATAA